jgi:hypothetical protein
VVLLIHCDIALKKFTSCTTTTPSERRNGLETDSKRFDTKFYYCEAGYVPRAGGCVKCSNGYHSRADDWICKACPVGTSAPDDDPAAPCTPCAAGYYASKVGSNTCSKCRAGTSSGVGATKCTDCPKGKASKAGQLCIACPAFTYAKDAGSSKCTPCNAPAGSQKGAYRCNKCVAGTSAEGTNATCKPCAKNYYSAAYAEDCKRCEPGYSSAPGSSVCTKYP